MLGKINIPRKKWLRGEGATASKLLRLGDRKQCCLGILCTQIGIPDEVIENKSSLEAWIGGSGIGAYKPRKMYDEVWQMSDHQLSSNEFLADVTFRDTETTYDDGDYKEPLIRHSVIDSFYRVNDALEKHHHFDVRSREEALTIVFAEIGLQVEFFDEEIQFV